VKEQGLSSYVRFTGMVAPAMIPYYYQLSDFFVSFSTTETQGLTYIEALAANLPVIAQDDVHLSSMIEEGVSGYLIPSPAAFNPLMASIIETPDRLKKLSPEHSKLLAPLSSKAYANNILKIYQSAISKSPS
jgi:1,2-diacylglycerol 3-alpha-glucosyltransferase